MGLQSGNAWYTILTVTCQLIAAVAEVVQGTWKSRQRDRGWGGAGGAGGAAAVVCTPFLHVHIHHTDQGVLGSTFCVCDVAFNGKLRLWLHVRPWLVGSFVTVCCTYMCAMHLQQVQAAVAL